MMTLISLNIRVPPQDGVLNPWVLVIIEHVDDGPKQLLEIHCANFVRPSLRMTKSEVCLTDDSSES